MSEKRRFKWETFDILNYRSFYWKPYTIIFCLWVVLGLNSHCNKYLRLAFFYFIYLHINRGTFKSTQYWTNAVPLAFSGRGFRITLFLKIPTQRIYHSRNEIRVHILKNGTWGFNSCSSHVQVIASLLNKDCRIRPISRKLNKIILLISSANK